MAAVVAIVLVLGLAASAYASPLRANPGAGDIEIQSGNMAPNAHDKTLQSILNMIPRDASVLTTSHLFPQLSNRPGAFIVPDHVFLPLSENYSQDINNWVAKSQFVALDFVVDPTNSAILLEDANLTGFGVFAYEGGTLVYERGWTAMPAVWVPYALTMPGGSFTLEGNSALATYAGSTAQVLLHKPGGKSGLALWTGPNTQDLLPGNYSATFNFALKAPDAPKVPAKPVDAFQLQVNEGLGFVKDVTEFTVSSRSYHAATYHAPPKTSTNSVLGQSLVKSNLLKNFVEFSRTINFTVSQTGWVNFVGYVESGAMLPSTMSLYLLSMTVTELQALP